MIVISLYDCLDEFSIDDILSQVYNHVHIYAHTYTHIHIHTPTNLHKVLPAVYYSCHSVISSCHESYQQNFDILLNYKQLVIYCYKKEKK